MKFYTHRNSLIQIGGLFKVVSILYLLSANISAKNTINYIDPVPNSIYVNLQNNITIGFEKPVNINNNIIQECISVTGSKSFNHHGKIILCNDNKKIIFLPDIPFEKEEKVEVKISGELLKSFSSEKNNFVFSFYTSARNQVINNVTNEIQDTVVPGKNTILAPYLTILVNNNPSNGYIFLAPYLGLTYLIITDKNGLMQWNALQPNFSGDFKMQPNGNFTFYNGFKFKHYELNQNFSKIDSFYCGNGYITDIHELRLLSNNNALVMAYDSQIVNMSQIVQGGDTAAHVIGTIIQEVDHNHNVVFQWRSWDHFAITDALHENLLAHTIDAVHGNSIEIDNDGNLILSSRHLDEITKINRTTGAIIWRFGGLNNQFTFINDPIHFNYQHAARRISNGNITIYDNGNFHTPHYSRAVEYQLNEQNKTATLVWQYNHTPNVFGSWGGYVQRLYNGNTLISWGGTTPTITEVNQQGTVVFEATYPSNFFTYRAYKYNIDTLLISVNGNHNSSPLSFRLEQNFPNPFNPSTQIYYDLPSASFVSLNVYDIMGREVMKIVSDYKKAGRYMASFDGSRFASGVYIYRLQAGDYTESRKMILLK